ncbi:ubiquitin elongating factor core-domain-containing protein [Suillus placidus]|uniref:Ubiquitin elongating factor core-domain-containing protein n=1 Tax=Suillus placidus TaxID=48579 RepID=A0A9P7A077_9AGAM|nr:ubiquitin elongating factor core-domain-containing protein [Suillus placidus]
MRAKRLAKLQAGSTSNPATPSPGPSSSTPVAHPKQKPPPIPPQSTTPGPPQCNVPLKRKSAPPVPKVDYQTWENNTISTVLKKSTAEATEYDLVWLKHLQAELESEAHMILTSDIVDRPLITRLELDAQAMSDDPEYVSVLASLPPQSVFEYLVGCWKCINTAKSTLLKKNPVSETQQATALLDKLRDLIISYTGLNLQEPEMFPQPADRPLSTLGSHELLTPMLSLSALSMPPVQPFLQDLAARFTDQDELLNTLSTLVCILVVHSLIIPSEGIGRSGGGSTWCGVIGGMEALMITRMPQWLGEGFGVEVMAMNFERLSRMRPLLRLGTFSRESPGIAQTYLSNPTKCSCADVDSSNASLRGTLSPPSSKSLTSSWEARERVLEYFVAVVCLNVKRAEMQVEPDTVALDSFMVNLQSVLLRFAEPFMDASYTKVYPYYFSVSTRIDLKEEMRIKATSNEAVQWVEESKPKAATPNFISDIFYLCNAHYGYIHMIQVYEDLGKTLDEYQRHHDMVAGDGSWMGMRQLSAYCVQLLDPELVFQYIGFTSFASTWLIWSVDPRGMHPNPVVELPLLKDVPMTFRVLPKFIIEDVVEFFLHSPESLDLSGKDELVIFALTFLTSTWYIMNPFLKAKINKVVFYGVLLYGNDRHGVLGHTLNTHPVALKNLIPALTSLLMVFSSEVEQTGASSQLCDKSNTMRNITYILKAIWDNPIHRDALNKEAQNVNKFIWFINLMINNVTYLMDKSLSELTQIHNIQTEMCALCGLERHASGYTTLGRSTAILLKDFTAETKGPFMMPEIMDKLAAMLDYNLNALHATLEYYTLYFIYLSPTCKMVIKMRWGPLA